MKIGDSRSLGWEEGVTSVSAKSVNTGTFRTALKAVEKNSKNMSSKIYNFSATQTMQYAQLQESKRTKVAALMNQLVIKAQRQADF